MNNGIEDRCTGKQPKSIENKGWFRYGCYDLCDRWKSSQSYRNHSSAIVVKWCERYDHWSVVPIWSQRLLNVFSSDYSNQRWYRWKPALMVLMMSETFLLWFIKSWAVLLSRWTRGWGICLLFWSQPGAFDGLVYPHPWEFAIFLKKMLMPGGWPGGGMGTAGIDWCIILSC